MAEMGLKKRNHLLPGAVPTIHALPEANLSEGKKRPIADSEEAEISDRMGKKQRRSRALQKLEVNRVSKKFKLLYFQILRMIQNKSIYCPPKNPSFSVIERLRRSKLFGRLSALSP